MTKTSGQERILKAVTENSYKGNPESYQLIFQPQLCRPKRKWQNIFKMMKKKKIMQPKILHPEMSLLRIEENIKSFPKLKESLITKPAL